MVMFPNVVPPFPAPFMEAVGNDPGGFAEAMAPAMEAFSDAMGGEGNLGDAMEAMGDAIDMGAMADMGITPEMFEGAGDAFMAVAGPAMQTMEPGAPPTEVGAAIEGCVQCCMGGENAPPMPPEISDMCASMGDAVVDAGVPPADMGAAMDCPPMPDGFVPGDPASMPADAPFCDSPVDVTMGPPIDPAVGAEGYDPGAAMGPMDPAMDPAMGPEIDPAAGMAPPDPTGELSGAEFTAPVGEPGPMDPGAAPGLDAAPVAGEFHDPGAMDAMGGALGGDPAEPAAPPPADDGLGGVLDHIEADTAGPPPPPQGPEAPEAPMPDMPDMPPPDDTDPSAGMG